MTGAAGTPEAFLCLPQPQVTQSRQTAGWGRLRGRPRPPHSYSLPFRPQPLGCGGPPARAPPARSPWGPPARALNSCLASTGLLEFGPGFSSAACLLPSGVLPQTSRPGRHLLLGTEDSVPPPEKASFYTDVQCSAPGPNLKGCSEGGFSFGWNSSCLLLLSFRCQGPAHF